MTAGGRRWISALGRAAVTAGVVLCAAAAWGQATAPADAAGSGPADPAQIVRHDLEQLAAKLNDPGARQEERDEAARRLVSRQSGEARKIVADALIKINPSTQTAAARALADDPNPDPAMIDPLFALLGPNRPLTEAAAHALANYKDHPQVLSRLIEYVQGRPPSEMARIAVIHAVGSMPQKRAAEYLIGLLSSSDESPAVRMAAAEALSDLTGLNEVVTDPQRWDQWWRVNSVKPEAEFRSDLLPRRSARYDQMREQFNLMSRETANLLKEQYRAAPQAQRDALLLRYLRSTEPQFRAVGAAIISDEAANNKPIEPPVREQLRMIIGDSSPVVRASVAEALGRINDAAAFEGLLAQLAQESDPQVRALLARALGPITDLRAVPVLMAMLSDPSISAASAAADSLKQLARPLRERDPVMAQRAAVALRDALENRTGTPATYTFRQKLVEAMVPLRQPELLALFTGMLNERRGETVEVRSLAIKGIGEIADRQSAGVLITALRDRDSRIREAAILALSRSPALAENAEPLRDPLDPAKEPDEAVRNAAWQALENVFPQLPKPQLVVWADRFTDQPARRLKVLKALEQQHLRDKDEDGLATTRVQIGEAHMALKEYKEAAENFGLALEYEKTQPSVPGGVIENIIRERMKALLAARDYATAADFASRTIAEDPTKAQDMGTWIWKEAQALRDAGEFQSAIDLIEAANQIRSLPPDYRDRIARVEQEVRARMSQQNGAQPPPGPRTAAGADRAPNGRSAKSN